MWTKADIDRLKEQRSKMAMELTPGEKRVLEQLSLTVPKNSRDVARETFNRVYAEDVLGHMKGLQEKGLGEIRGDLKLYRTQKGQEWVVAHGPQKGLRHTH